IPKSAAFGIPGPVVNGRAKSTNLPWIVDEENLSKKIKIPSVKIVNDLAATAYAVPYLKPEELITIKEGAAEHFSQCFAVIAPGTGLGQAFMLCEGNKRIVIPSEGGHSDFAPSNKLETELFLYLKKKYDHVSYERIISGSGIPNIFDFLIEVHHLKPEDKTLTRMKTEDKAKVISDMALEQKDKVCEKALDIFVSVLGAHAGNFVLTTMATGGIYLGGGIPFKILPKLKDGTFVKSFSDKGRLNKLVGATPIFVINNNQAALNGAARIALEIENNK
ncbi:MAG: glucokinase, partial [Bacteroidetes bacterium]|nr:glucokinase [Bacteroidota bacterium]